MPASRMKTKKITRLSEGHVLRVCHKSSKVSKDSDSYHFIAPKTGSILENIQDSSSVTFHFENPDGSSQVQEMVDKKESGPPLPDQNSDLPLELLDTVHEGSQFIPVPDTIFSSIIDYRKALAEPTDDIDTGLYDVNESLPSLTDSSDDCCVINDHQSFDLTDDLTSYLCPILPFEGEIGFPNWINMDSYEYDHIHINSSEYDHIDDSLTFGHEFTMLPFYEKKLDGAHFSSFCNELPSVMSLQHSSFYNELPTSEMSLQHSCDSAFLVVDLPVHFGISQLQQTEQGAHNSFYTKDEYFIQDTLEAIFLSQPFLSVDIWKGKSITLVLDLDETLVHSSFEHWDIADFTFSMFYNNKDQTVYVKKRPFLHQFLEQVALMFEVVIFTASKSFYAAKLLDQLDPNKKLISKRMYRESCTFSGGRCTKDLTILGIDLAKVAIIDNSPQVFHLQVNNGIPIKSWYDDPTDCALISLLPFLETLVNADDVRPLITQFNNNEQLDACPNFSDSQ